MESRSFRCVERLAIPLASAAVAAYAFEFVFAYFAAQRVAVDSQLFRAAGLIALAAFQNTADKLFLEFTDCFFEQDSSLDHHSDQRFQLIFHDCTLRSGASEWAIPWAQSSAWPVTR
jgi:hypothetical protein